jgi:hypothetical protein
MYMCLQTLGCKFGWQLDIKKQKNGSCCRTPKVPRWQLITNLYRWHVQWRFPNMSKIPNRRSIFNGLEISSLAIHFVSDWKHDPRASNRCQPCPNCLNTVFDSLGSPWFCYSIDSRRQPWSMGSKPQHMSTQRTTANFIESASHYTIAILGKVKQPSTTKPDYPINNAANSRSTYHLLQIKQHLRACTFLAVITASSYL